MMQRLLSILLASALMTSSAWAAEACQSQYTVRPNDTIFSIARNNLGDSIHWPLILDSNPELMGTSLVDGQQGMILTIPCMDLPDEVVAPTNNKLIEIKLLTSAHYAPFADQATPNQGLMIELVEAALDAAPSQRDFSITWEDNWSQHLDPLLSQHRFDMGFPWPRPNCDAQPTGTMCQEFIFSEPLISLPINLFVKAEDEQRYQTNTDIVGKSVCRPQGFSTFDLDGSKRGWIRNNKIALVTGVDFADCFNKLHTGNVDAVFANLVVGAKSILNLGLRYKVIALEQPVSEQELYVIVSKQHPQAATYISQFNTGLKTLRDNGNYEELVSRYYNDFQALFK